MPDSDPPKRPTGDPSARAVLEAIRHVVRELRVSSRAAEGAVGLSGAQLFVLQKLAEAGVLSLNELAARTLTHQSSVSVVVQKLAARELIVRRRAEDDARRYELAITLRGRALLRKAPGAAQERLIAAVEGLAPARRRALAEGLTELVRGMGVPGAGERPAALFFEDEAPAEARKVRPRAPSKGARRG